MSKKFFGVELTEKEKAYGFFNWLHVYLLILKSPIQSYLYIQKRKMTFDQKLESARKDVNEYEEKLEITAHEEKLQAVKDNWNKFKKSEGV